MDPSQPIETYSKKHPFPATMLVNRPLTGPGAEKEVRHIELSLKGSGYVYEPGDSLGVFPTNCPELVEELLEVLQASGQEVVPGNQGNFKPFREALLHDYQITQPSPQFLSLLAERTAEPGLSRELIAENAYPVEGAQIIDWLQKYPAAKFTPVELVACLRKLQPRLYSIASGPTQFPDRVHLTVAVVRYEAHGRERKGVASTYLAHRVEEDTHSPCFIHSAKGFRLPQNPDTPVIMVGPGTGVAPFRSFLQERLAVGATGRNWLFFGGPHENTDFLYREEFGMMVAEGVLTRLDTAFSRDQAQKIYVQHRMMENAVEIWRWLEEGAYFYICGDAKRMAVDVEEALLAIIEKEGAKSPMESMAYMEELRSGKRLRKDVY